MRFDATCQQGAGLGPHLLVGLHARGLMHATLRPMHRHWSALLAAGRCAGLDRAPCGACSARLLPFVRKAWEGKVEQARNKWRRRRCPAWPRSQGRRASAQVWQLARPCIPARKWGCAHCSARPPAPRRELPQIAPRHDDLATHGLPAQHRTQGVEQLCCCMVPARPGGPVRGRSALNLRCRARGAAPGRCGKLVSSPSGSCDGPAVSTPAAPACWGLGGLPARIGWLHGPCDARPGPEAVRCPFLPWQASPPSCAPSPSSKPWMSAGSPS